VQLAAHPKNFKHGTCSYFRPLLPLYLSHAPSLTLSVSLSLLSKQGFGVQLQLFVGVVVYYYFILYFLLLRKFVAL